MLQLVSCLRGVLSNQHCLVLFLKKGNSDMKVLFAITCVYHTPAYFTNSSLHSHVSANSLRTYSGFCLDLFCFLLGWRPLSVGLRCFSKYSSFSLDLFCFLLCWRPLLVGLRSFGCSGRLNRRRLNTIKPQPLEGPPAQLIGLQRLVSRRNSNFTGTS